MDVNLWHMYLNEAEWAFYDDFKLKKKKSPWFIHLFFRVVKRNLYAHTN